MRFVREGASCGVTPPWQGVCTGCAWLWVGLSGLASVLCAVLHNMLGGWLAFVKQGTGLRLKRGGALGLKC
jgi:hypothetical protein